MEVHGHRRMNWSSLWKCESTREEQRDSAGAQGCAAKNTKNICPLPLGLGCHGEPLYWGFPASARHKAPISCKSDPDKFALDFFSLSPFSAETPKGMRVSSIPPITKQHSYLGQGSWVLCEASKYFPTFPRPFLKWLKLPQRAYVAVHDISQTGTILDQPKNLGGGR